MYLLITEVKRDIRFLYLKTKIPPHTANLEQDFPKIKEAAYEEKTSKVVSDWLRKKKKIYLHKNR